MKPLSDVAIRVLESRYLRRHDGKLGIETPEQLFGRVAKAIANAEMSYADLVGIDKAKANEALYAVEFERMMADLDFLPNSPTLMNAGIPGAQLSACFVLPVEDDVESIFDAVKNMALIFKSGGGVGMSMSRLRQKGSLVKSTGGVSSGPVSFMRVYNTTAEVVAQGGKRRGALMGTLRIDHPDIMEFIKVKQDLTQLTSFNLSVAVTDEFMRALSAGDDFMLRDPRDGKMVIMVPAQDIWNDIVECAWKTGEPGLIFIDTINAKHHEITGIDEKIEATNPCGEQPLLPYESCNLGSINLSNFVIEPFTERARVDHDRLRTVSKMAARFLDNVIDVNNYPISDIRQKTLTTRKIGLGVMGFADMLVKLGHRYGTPDTIGLLGAIMEAIHGAADAMSFLLAAERGPFMGCTTTPARCNATLTTIAPTGSISMIADVTGGIEPMFSVVTKRESVLDGKPFVQVSQVVRELLQFHRFDDSRVQRVIDSLAQGASFRDATGDDKGLYEFIVCAHEVAPDIHVAMQAEAQKHVDAAISKSVNLPRNAEKSDVYGLFIQAYESGCKGITVYRDGCREHQPMSAPAKPDTPPDIRQTKAEKRHIKQDENFSVPVDPDIVSLTPLSIARVEARTPKEEQEFKDWLSRHCTRVLVHQDLKIKPKERPDTLTGHTVKIQTGCGKLYVTVNFGEDGNPVELFARHGKAGVCSQAQCEAIGRLGSMSLRSGVDPQSVVDQLRGITCHETAGMGPSKVLSCADGIAQALVKALTVANPPAPGDDPSATHFKPVYSGACPMCGAGAVREGGCAVCKACGWTKCS